MKPIGPTFGDELAAAGLSGLPFAWGDEGVISGRERLTPEQNAALDAVLAAHAHDRVTPADVKEEAQRRIIALTGASTLEACLIKQLNASMRAIELNDKRTSGATLNDTEAAEAAALRALATAIKAVRSASNVLEAMRTIPADYASDKYWVP